MDVLHYAKEIVLKLVRKGYIAYYAGGWVRDYVMKHPSSDVDIATNAPPEVILDLFPQTVLVGLNFGVIIVIINGHAFEVSTFRRDVNYVSGRFPERIELSTPEEDAQRRDFTINGMFYDPVEEVIYDYVQGVEDIKRGIIRTIGNPQERFMEDRLRMIRAVRFTSRFGFLMDPETHEAIIENADTLFPAVAMERVWQEFNKMSDYPRFDAAIIELHRTGLLPVIFPALEGVHLRDIKHRVAPFPHFPEKTPTILFLMELFPEASLADFQDLGQYLKVSNQDMRCVESAYHGRQLLQKEREAQGTISAVQWAYFYADPYSSIIIGIEAAKLSPEDRELFLEQHALRLESLGMHVQRLEIKKPLVLAEALKNEGIAPSRLMGILLKEAESLAITYNLHDSQQVIELLKQSPLWPK